MKKIELYNKTKVIKNDTINTIDFIFIFPCPYVREEVMNLKLANLIVSSTSKNFPEEKDYRNFLEEKMIIKISSTTRVNGDGLFIQIELTVPKEGLIKDFSLEEAFQFFVQTVYEPNIEKDAFDEKKFTTEKEYIRNQIIDGNRGIYNIGFNKFKAILDPEEKVFLSLDHQLEYLEKTTPTSAYQAYKKCVLDNHFISYVYGDISEERVMSLFQKYLPFFEEKIKMEINYKKRIANTPFEYKEEKSQFQQGALYLGYRIKEYDEIEEPVFSIIMNILNAPENDLIFESLRLKNNLVYNVRLAKHIKEGFFYIETYLANENKERAIELIKETFEQLKNKEFLENCKAKLMRGMEIEIMREEDQKYNKLDYIISRDLQLSTLQSIYESYKTVTIEDIIAFLEKIELSKIFFLEGSESNEKNR